MIYQEAIEKALTVKWKVGTCQEGEKCWCRTIEPAEPILFEDGNILSEYYIIRSGEVIKETVEHLVKLHNQYLDNEQQ